MVSMDDFEQLVAKALAGPVGERLTSGQGRLYREVINRVERPLLRHVLGLVGGNQLRAARILGINRNTLRKRLRQLGLMPAGRGSEVVTG
jgi:two-component system nitrogen regulation response regulator GlnG